MTNGIIVIDGCDACGKTVLAAHLKSHAEAQGSTAEVIHLGKPIKGDSWRLNVATLETAITEAFVNKKLVILDRHFISELVYGDVFRGGSEFPHTARHLDRLLHRFRALRVICAPPVEVVLENHARLSQERHEEYKNQEMRDVAHRYLNLWQGDYRLYKNIPRPNYQDYAWQLTSQGGIADTAGWYHYDFTIEGKDLPGYCEYLLKELSLQQLLVPEKWLDPKKAWFTGFPHQRAVLLVGDKLGKREPAENTYDIPFLSNKNSSRFLAETLAELGADESRVVITNINDWDSQWVAVQQLQKLCGRTVVLGRQAEDSMLRASLFYDARVRHPQHARRFDGGGCDSYAAELRRAFNGYAGVVP